LVEWKEINGYRITILFFHEMESHFTPSARAKANMKGEQKKVTFCVKTLAQRYTKTVCIGGACNGIRVS